MQEGIGARFLLWRKRGGNIVVPSFSQVFQKRKAQHRETSSIVLSPARSKAPDEQSLEALRVQHGK